MQLDKIGGDEMSCKIFQAKNQPVKLDSKALPWKGELSPLVSLLDMINFGVEDFSVFLREVEALCNDDELFDSSRPGLTAGEVSQIYELLEKASNWSKLVEFESASELIRHIQIRILESGWGFLEEPYGLIGIGESILMLRNIMKDELRGRLFIYIPKDQAEWYEKKDGFGPRVSDAFLSAIEDIKESGNCYATERYTACVFHLMRVLEHGLKALAINVGLTFEKKTWGKIIGMIDKKVDDFYKSNPRSEAEIERLQFLSEAATDFRYFKNSWRDHVSHLRYTCKDRQEALLILNHVKSFMIHLSKKLRE